MMDRSNSEKKFYDEIYIAFRNEMEEYEEDLKRVEAVGENKILLLGNEVSGVEGNRKADVGDN